MIIQIRQPAQPLAEFVQAVVFHEGYTAPHDVDRFLPDGGVEIVIDLTDEPKPIYDNDTLQVVQTCTDAWVSGMRTGYITIPSGRDSSMMVISFKPGAAFHFFHVPLDTLTDRVVDADHVFGTGITSLRNEIRDTTPVDAKFEAVYRWLLSRLEVPRNGYELVRMAAGRIQNTPTMDSIDALAHETGITHKHLISVFRKYLGITPKQFQRVMRFQQVVQEIDSAETIDWISIAHDCGFYDQSHFIREFKHFSGFNPSSYLEARSDVLNYVPVA